MTWMDRAACLGEPTALFFDDDLYPHAKRICAGCPVALECLEHALDNGEWAGIWGGLSPRERSRLKRRRASHRRRTLALLRENEWDAEVAG